MERDKTIDFLRVLAIFLVIIIHIANCYCRHFDEISGLSYSIACVFNILARISVPIFFMISGALLIPKVLTMKKYISRVKKMIIILVLWTLIYAIFEYFYMGKPTDFLSLLIVPQRAHLWFMYAIVAIYIALPFINKMANNLTKKEENLFIILWFLAGIFIFSVKRLTGASVVYLIPIVSGTYYLGYFLIGHIIYKRIKGNTSLYKKYSKKLLLIFALANIIIIIITLVISFKTNSFYKVMLTYSNPLSMISSLSIYCYLLIEVKKVPRFISYLAPFAFGIYLVHGIFLEIFKNNIDFLKINSFLVIPLFAFILFIISFVIIYLIKKIPKINKYIC